MRTKEKTMMPYQYVHNNPIMFTDPTGMSAEGGGGGLWSRIMNSAKSFLGISSNEKPAESPIDHTELDEITISANRKPNWFQRNFSKDKLSNDWKNIKERSGFNHFKNYKKDLAGGTGAIRFLGFGSENTEGRGEINGKTKYVKVGDMSTYSFASARVIQHWVEALSKGVSMGEDGNIKGWFKEDNPTVHHSYKKFGIYQIPYTSKNIIYGKPSDTMIRRSEIKRFDEIHQFDSLRLVPILNR